MYGWFNSFTCWWSQTWLLMKKDLGF
jgi:hypothetical protein